MAKEGEEGSNDFGKWRSSEVKMLFVETEERKEKESGRKTHGKKKLPRKRKQLVDYV